MFLYERLRKYEQIQLVSKTVEVVYIFDGKPNF